MNFGYFCNTTNWDKKPYTQLLDEAREIMISLASSNSWVQGFLSQFVVLQKYPKFIKPPLKINLKTTDPTFVNF